ncbi:MAG: hypothetical protein Q4B28_04170 [bacterium]|nr:hypothetical protein [bacterium]
MSENTLELNGQIFHQFTPKEVMYPGMELLYLTPTSYGKLKILALANAQGKPLEKATCNTPNIYIHTDTPLFGGELFYLPPPQH